MKLRGVNIIITSLVFTYESGDCPLSFFFAKHQLPLAKNNVRKYGAHLACSLVDLEVNLFITILSSDLDSKNWQSLSTEEKRNIA